MKTVAIIPSRFDSNRLPGKALADLAGAPMLGRLAERTRRSRRIDEVVVATTDLASDDAIEELCREQDIGCFRGSSTDVLGRIVAAAKAYEADLIVELMGDSPLIHRELLDATVEAFEAGEYDYLCSYTNTVKLDDHEDHKAFPVGIWAQVFPTTVMAECARYRTDAYSREHSTTAMYKHPHKFRLGYLEARGAWEGCNRPDLFLAVNYQKQLELVRAIFERCLLDAEDFDLVTAIKAADAIIAQQPTLRHQG